ncbi:substrate-binding domain-containing protein [Halococcus agarilyticus]|uniref:substrate-binding domain-containing protein n=1 Tax=Halococcus agarilyticus TaxID=1232219 RepID=UPI000677B9E2|nr:substrate-binding domain-containing protein [Halococcus agarilyticus]
MAIDREKIREKGAFSIELGIPRRELLKQLGALGTAGALAGCSSVLQDTGNGTDSGDGTDGSGNQSSGNQSSGNQSGGNQSGGGQGGGGQAEFATDFEYSRIPMVPPPTAPIDNANPETGPERRAEFVIQNVANPFFTPLIAGFNDALNQFGWNGGVNGPSGGTQSQSQQIEIINTTIDQLQGGRDVLVTTILDNQAYIDPIQRALDNDIAVINGHSTPSEEDWNNELMRETFSYKDSPIIIPHVGIRDRRGGIAMAAEAYDRMQNQLDADQYTVLIGNGLPGNPAVTRRVDPGARSFFQTKDDVTVIDETLDVTTEFAEAQSRVESRLSTNQDINVVMGAGFWTPVGASQAVESGNISRDMVICGFDFTEAVLTSIRDGSIDFTMGQDPYGQGFLNVPLAWMYLDRGIEMKHLEFGVTYVDEENVDYALQRNTWSELRDWQEQNL